MTSIEVVESLKIFAVIRAETQARALTMAEACIAGGISLIEVTFSFDRTPEVIKKLSDIKEAHVGAGTVLDLDMAAEAAYNGAEFIVSPHTDPEILSFSKQRGLFSVSGAATSNEIVHAVKLGADMVKVFPAAQLGGPAYVKAMKDPLPGVKILVTGGVNESNLGDYLASGATAAGMVSSLFGPDGNASPQEIKTNARRLLGLVSSLNS